MTASDEQRARLRGGKGPPQEGWAHLRKEGATTRKVVAFADETTSELTGGRLCSSGDYGDAHTIDHSSWIRPKWLRPRSCVSRHLLGQCPEVLTMVVNGVWVFADVHCAYSALWDVSL